MFKDSSSKASLSSYEHVVEIIKTTTKFNPDSIPKALTDLPHWVCWSLVRTNRHKQDEKPSKRPIRLSSNNPYNQPIDISRWKTPDRQYTFEHCLKTYLANQDIIAGLGFIPNPDDGIVVIDYDGLFDSQASDNTSLLPFKTIGDPRIPLINIAASETFVELSQSGSGAHVFFYASLSERHNDSATSGVELYPGKKQSFVAMTGIPYGNSPSVLSTNQELLDKHIQQFFQNKQSKQSKPTFVIPTRIPSGTRNSALTQACGYYFSLGLDIAAVTAELSMLNSTACDEPVSQEELSTIIKSIADRHNSKFQSLVANIYHVQETNTWFDCHNSSHMVAESLNITYQKKFPGGKGRLPKISKWLPEQHNFKQVADITWYPTPYGTEQERIIELDGRQYLNIWTGFSLEPTSGDVQPWLNLLEHIVPELNYRRALLWWLAYTLQHPDRKINWQPVILGVSGAGKDALFRPIAQILGRAYKMIGNKEIKGDYDDGLYQTKLLHISEAQGLSGSSIEFYKRITATEASNIMDLNIKSKSKVKQINVLNVIVITNNLDAMKFDENERRPLVLRAPSVMINTQKLEYFDNWLDKDGASNLFHYLLNHDLSEYNAGERPYRTTHFEAMFDMTQSDEDVVIREYLENLELDAIRSEFVKTKLGLDGRYSLLHIKKLLDESGWVRWDSNNEHGHKKIQAKMGDKVISKSRDWYVRKGSKQLKLKSTDMYILVDSIENRFLKNSKF